MSRPRSPFQISVLMPAWIIRTVFMLVPFLICIVFLALFIVSQNTLSQAGITFANKSKGEVIGLFATSIAFTFICYILDIAAIILYTTRKLSARLFLIFSAIQMTLWTAVLAVAIVLGTWAITAFVLLVYFFFIGILVYAVVVFRRERVDGSERGDYEKAGAAKHFGQNPSSLSFMSGAIHQSHDRYTPVPGHRDSSLSYS